MTDTERIVGPEAIPPDGRPETPVELAVETTQETRPSADVRPPTPAAEAAVVAPGVAVAAPPSQFTKDPVLKKVEAILEEDLADTYAQLSPALQQQFKKKGEVTATAIQQMVASAKVQAKKVLKLIVDWLRVIPHVNRFFLEQEAKIKTDRILALAEKEQQKKI